MPRAGRYEVWLGGSVRPEVDLTVDGRPAGARCGTSSTTQGEYVLLGRAQLGSGRHSLAIRFDGADLHPGSGGAPSPVGPLQLSAGDTAQTRVIQLPSERSAELCGKPWDWIEALAPGGAATD